MSTDSISTQSPLLQELDLILVDPELTQFEILIFQLISKDQDQVSRAKSLFDLALRDRPDSLLLALSKLLSCGDSLLRAEAAKHLGEIFTNFFSSIYLEEKTLGTLKSEILRAFENELSKSNMKILSRTISDFYVTGGWPELLPYLFECVNSQRHYLQEYALLAFKSLAENSNGSTALIPHLETFQEIFLEYLGNCWSWDVKLAALDASISFVLFVPNWNDPYRFDYLLRLMMKTLTEALNSGSESKTEDSFYLLIKLARTNPRFFVRQLEKVWRLMLKITRDDSLEVGIRHLGIKFLMALVEKAPSMITKEPEFIKRLFDELIYMLFDIDGVDDAAAYNTVAFVAGSAARFAAGIACAAGIARAAAYAFAAITDVALIHVRDDARAVAAATARAAAAAAAVAAAFLDADATRVTAHIAYYAAQLAAIVAASADSVTIPLVDLAAGEAAAFGDAVAVVIGDAVAAALGAARSTAVDAAAAVVASIIDADIVAVVARDLACRYVDCSRVDAAARIAVNLETPSASSSAACATAAAAADSDGDEVDNFWESSNYILGKECLSKLSILLGEKTIFQWVLRLFSHLLGTSIWQQRHAVLIAVPEIAKGCYKVMLQNLDEIVPEILKSLNDLHPYVRLAAIKAIRQLSVDFGPELQTRYHEIVLIILYKIMEDSLRPKLQVAALSAALTFLTNGTEKIIDLYKWRIIDEFRKFLQSGKIFISEDFFRSEFVKIASMLPLPWDITQNGKIFISEDLFRSELVKIDARWSGEFNGEYSSLMGWLQSFKFYLRESEINKFDAIMDKIR